MGDNCPDKDFLSSEQKRNYYKALTKVFLYQNKDGSWGNKSKHQVTLTSQAIQLMYALKLGHEENAFKKATRWLEDNVKSGDPHWTTRVEVGLKIGEFEKLLEEKYIDAFITDLEFDLSNPNDIDRLDFFWDVIPTLIALYPYESRYKEKTGKSVPHDKVIKRVLGYCEFFNNIIAVQNYANYTGLVALYFSIIGENEKYQECKDYSVRMINWLIANRMEKKEEGTIFWQLSQGITSYVLIDLLGCRVNDSQLPRYIPKILKYLTPDDNGNVREENITTYGVDVNREPLYITIVILRAITEVMAKYDSNEFNKFQSAVRNPSGVQILLGKVGHFFYYYKAKIPLAISAILVINAVYVIIKGSGDLGFFLLSIGVSGALSIFYEWLRR